MMRVMRICLLALLITGILSANDIVFKLNQTLEEASTPIQAVGIAHDGGQFVTTSTFGGEVFVYQKKNGSMELIQIITNKFNEVWAIDMNDEYWLGIGGDHYVAVYSQNNSSKQFEPVQLLEEIGEGNAAIQLTNNHSNLIVGKQNCSVLVYNWGKPEENVDKSDKFMLNQTIFYPGSSGCRVWSMSLSKDYKFLAVGRVGNSVSMYKFNGASWDSMLTLSFSSYDYRLVKISSDHKRVLVGAKNNQVVSIYFNNGTALQFLQNVYAPDTINSIDLSNDQKLLAVGCSNDAYVYENVTGTFTQIERIKTNSLFFDSLMASKFSYNQQYLYVGSTSSSFYVYHQVNQTFEDGTTSKKYNLREKIVDIMDQ